MSEQQPAMEATIAARVEAERTNSGGPNGNRGSSFDGWLLRASIFWLLLVYTIGWFWLAWEWIVNNRAELQPAVLEGFGAVQAGTGAVLGWIAHKLSAD